MNIYLLILCLFFINCEKSIDNSEITTGKLSSIASHSKIANNYEEMLQDNNKK